MAIDWQAISDEWLDESALDDGIQSEPYTYPEQVPQTDLNIPWREQPTARTGYELIEPYTTEETWFDRLFEVVKEFGPQVVDVLGPVLAKEDVDRQVIYSPKVLQTGTVADKTGTVADKTGYQEYEKIDKQGQVTSTPTYYLPSKSAIEETLGPYWMWIAGGVLLYIVTR